MERQLLRLAERTAGRLRKAALSAGTVQVKIRQSDFSTFTRQKRLKPRLNGNPDARIRLLGVGCSSLAPAEQPDLFGDGYSGQASEFDRAIDEIRDRFGSDSVARARTLDRP
jgi:DNA polymerase-4